MKALAYLALSICCACGSTEKAQTPEPSSAPAENIDPIAALRAHEAELMARAEHDATEVRVRHVLVAFQGASRSRATRTKDEAEALAAELYQRLLGGADPAGDAFGELARQYSDDSGPGIYSMTTGTPGGGVSARALLVPAFGDVGWRLEVGEVGVAPYDAQRSPFGWHVIKRLR
jgi:peptidyl-prolyl cis-trans isomerase C/peptidyl-prolyl cis-trans isomerase SurA